MGATAEHSVVVSGLWSKLFKSGVGFFSQCRLTSLTHSEQRHFRLSGKWCMLTDVYVHPVMRDRGLAKARVAEAIAWASANHLACVLEIRKHGKGGLSNKVLVKFYEAFGFEPHPTIEGCMIRRL